MRIIKNKNEVLDKVILCLTPKEARELADSAADLAEHPENQHHHVYSRDYQTEIEVAVYTRENLEEFNPDFRTILREALDSE